MWGNIFEVLDVGDGSGEFDVIYVFMMDGVFGDFYVVVFVDDVFEVDVFVFVVGVFLVVGWFEDLFFEEVVFFGF